MPITYYTEKEVGELTQLLSRCFDTIEDGPASEVARQILLRDVAVQLGWQDVAKRLANSFNQPVN